MDKITQNMQINMPILFFMHKFEDFMYFSALFYNLLKGKSKYFPLMESKDWIHATSAPP